MKERKQQLSKPLNRPYRKNTRRYRLIMMYINMFFVLFIAAFIVVGIMFTFTGKRKYHDEGVSYYRSGEYELAINSFKKSLGKDQWFSEKLDVDTMMYTADCYMQLGDFDSALTIYEGIKTNYAKKNYDDRQLDKCISMVNALISFGNGDYSYAVTKAIANAVENDHPELNLYLAACYEQNGDLDSMYNAYNAYEAAFGKNAYLCNRYATYYVEKREYNRALDYVNDGLSFDDPEFNDGLLRLRIRCLSCLGEYDKAYEYAKEYVKSHPNDTEAKENLMFLATRVTTDDTTVYELYYGVPGADNENKGNLEKQEN